MKILVVCHGNINRSPLCAAVLRQERPDWEVREAALKSWERPDWRSERAARKMRIAAAAHGIDLEAHRSRPITTEDLDWADAVIFMDSGNYRRLLAIRPDGPGGGRQWVSLGHLVGIRRVPDPNFMRGDSAEFADVVDLILSASREAARKLIAVDF